MTADITKDWVAFTVPLAKGRLEGWYPQGCEAWKEAGPAFWNDTLEGFSVFRRSRAATVYQGSLPGDARVYFAKKMPVRPERFDMLKHMVRASRARRALEQGERLKEAGFHVPHAVCLLEERAGGRIRGSGLVTEAVLPDASMQDALGGETLDGVDRPRLLEAYGREVARIHQAGIFHGDMRQSNVLYDEQDGAFCFTWLDNERNKVFDSLPERYRVHNLVRVNMERSGVTLHDRLRFWRAYLRHSGLSREEARRLRERVRKKTEARWQQRDAEV